MAVDLLAIAAHRDDVELTCAGTLLKAVDAGYRTGILDLTAGESGTRGSLDGHVVGHHLVPHGAEDEAPQHGRVLVLE